MAHTRRIDRLAGRVVVAAVEHHGGIAHQAVQSRSIHPGLQRSDLHLRVDVGHGLRRRLDFGSAHTGCGVRDLALQVG